MKVNITFILICAFILFNEAKCSADEIYSKNRTANELYKNGKYDEALKIYEDALLLSPSDEKLKMNKGSSLFNLGEFDKAEESYNEALSIKDKKTRADAHYNMGNILFKKAEQIQQSDLQGAQEKYKSAMDHYIKSLDLSSADIDAKWNLQLAYQKIKELQQQQQQQQQQKNKDKNKDDKDKDKNKDKDDKQKNDNQQQDENKDKKEQQQQPQDQNEKQQKDKEEQQQQSQESPEQKDMKKEDARRLIELYADDADSLNKPSNKNVKTRQPEQDW